MRTASLHAEERAALSVRKDQRQSLRQMEILSKDCLMQHFGRAQRFHCHAHQGRVVPAAHLREGGLEY
jgi:hypothetical protein